MIIKDRPGGCRDVAGRTDGTCGLRPDVRCAAAKSGMPPTVCQSRQKRGKERPLADIFVSYSRQDKGRVAPVVAALESVGWTIW